MHAVRENKGYKATMKCLDCEQELQPSQGTPEDLIFFYKHLSLGGKLLRIDEPLVVYRYHQDSESFNIDR